jgi:mRNA interferase HicA
VKRRELLAHLRKQECEFLREGAKHSWWVNSETGARSAVPRHPEISDVLCRRSVRTLECRRCEREDPVGAAWSSKRGSTRSCAAAVGKAV